jgi:hypothetical protein
MELCCLILKIKRKDDLFIFAGLSVSACPASLGRAETRQAEKNGTLLPYIKNKKER